MAKPNLHSSLTYLIRKSFEWENGYLNALSAGERTATGTYEQWAPKDRIAHILYWRRRAVEKLAYVSRGQNPPEYPPFEECNRRNFEETWDKPLEALLREAEEVLKTIPQALSRFSEEDLLKTGYHPSLKERSLAEYILDQGYSHPVYHVCEAYLRLGNHRMVNRIQDQRVEDLDGIDNSPRTHATTCYDRACFYALTGDSERALEYLQVSLAGRPDFITWAVQDVELASLHGDPRFQALVAGAAENPPA